MKQKLLIKNKAFRFKRFARKTYSAFNSMHKMVNIGVLSGAMLTFASVTETAAQTSKNKNQQDSIPEQKLEEVIVTSSKGSLTQSQMAQIVTVITRTEIEQAPVQSIQDLLKYISGIDVRQRGPNGVQSDISLRGSTQDQTAILLNGANLCNPQTGHYSFDFPINLSDIERIEIIQGASSLFYGAGAFSGGINIITKKQSDSKAYLNIEGGMHELFNIGTRGSIQSGSWNHHLSAGYNYSAGYMNNSDYKIFNTLWQSNWKGNDSGLDFQLGFNDKKYGANIFYSVLYPNQFDDTQSLFASVRGETGKQFKIKPQIYWNRHWDCFQLFRDGTGDIPSWYTGHNYHRSDVYGFNLNMQYTSRLGISSFGGEFRNEGILSNVLGKPMDNPQGKYTKSDNRNNISYFAEQNFLWKKISLSIGILANYNTSFDKKIKFYPSVSLSYQMLDDIKLYSSWSKATRMPTFTDLYYTTQTHIGNSDLSPEESQSYEAGLKYNNKYFSSCLSGFYMQGKNIIDWIKENLDDRWESRNLTELNKIGFETSISLRLNSIFKQIPTESKFELGYTYIHQTKSASDLYSKYALDYLKHKLVAQLNHPVWKNISVDWQFRWQDRGSYDHYDGKKAPVEIDYPAYSILDLKINWKQKKLNVYASVNNLFDTKYYDLMDIHQPGFWLSGGVVVNLNSF